MQKYKYSQENKNKNYFFVLNNNDILVADT